MSLVADVLYRPPQDSEIVRYEPTSEFFLLAYHLGLSSAEQRELDLDRRSALLKMVLDERRLEGERHKQLVETIAKAGGLKFK